MNALREIFSYVAGFVVFLVIVRWLWNRRQLRLARTKGGTGESMQAHYDPNRAMRDRAPRSFTDWLLRRFDDPKAGL